MQMISVKINDLSVGAIQTTSDSIIFIGSFGQRGTKMRVFLEIFIPLGIFLAVLMTPYYFQKDRGKVKNEDTALLTTDYQISKETTSAAKAVTKPATTTRSLLISKMTSSRTMTTFSTETSTPETTISTTINTLILTATRTTTTIASPSATSTTFTPTTIATTTMTATTHTTSTTTTECTTIWTTRTTTMTTTPLTTKITTSTTTGPTTTTTTEQDKNNPCPFECSNEDECRVIIGNEAQTPLQNTQFGTIEATKQFRLNVGIDFPSEAANNNYNMVHVIGNY